MTKGLAGYGRYDDGTIGCPRANTDMTPCVARDLHAEDDGGACVGCGAYPGDLLRELVREVSGIEPERLGVEVDKIPPASELVEPTNDLVGQVAVINPRAGSLPSSRLPRSGLPRVQTKISLGEFRPTHRWRLTDQDEWLLRELIATINIDSRTTYLWRAEDYRLGPWLTNEIYGEPIPTGE